MIVCVSGGRKHRLTYEGRKILSKLYKYWNVHALVNGEATGIDADAKAVAKLMDIEIISYPALWQERGLKAGPERNEEMAQKLIEEKGMLIVFSGGPGTKHMFSYAVSRHIPVINLQNSDYCYEGK